MPFFRLCLLIALVLGLCACSPVVTEPADDGYVIGSSSSEEAKAAFILPADAYTLEDANAPLEQQKLWFSHDEQGRITQTYYYQNGLEMYVKYAYSEDSVIYTAFCDTHLVDHGVLPLTGYDAAIGLSEYEGHFLTHISK